MQSFLSPRLISSFFTAFLSIVCLLSTTARAQTDQVIYTDSLQNNWQNYSWATVNFNNSNPVHDGSASISVNAAAWQALYLHHPAQSSDNYTNLVFWIHGGASGGQRLQVQGLLKMPRDRFAFAIGVRCQHDGIHLADGGLELCDRLFTSLPSCYKPATH